MNATPAQVSHAWMPGSQSVTTPSPAHTATVCAVKPTLTPVRCGSVRRIPKRAPEASSMMLFGPGVIDITKV
jgi:hypothetical protein